MYKLELLDISRIILYKKQFNGLWFFLMVRLFVLFICLKVGQYFLLYNIFRREYKEKEVIVKIRKII